MPKIGQLFQNPATGERVEFLETGRETGGKYVRFKATMPKGKGFEVAHFHPFGDETFEVLSGTLRIKLNGKTQKISKGQSIVLPKNQAHAHWNADEEELVVVQTISPCLDVDQFLENLFGLAMDGKLDKTGRPAFLQVMLWIRLLQNKTYLATIPKWVQDALSVLLFPPARLLGYRAFYEKYTAR
ncbi:MAG: cupin domain-containing protein [Saprospiraceae bacterium]|nr:cupin domain-containing protein [Saprospiraceae bacterium]